MTPNVAASVHQRLLNRAHAAGRPFNELLQYFVLKRFLYRLGRSPHARQVQWRAFIRRHQAGGDRQPAGREPPGLSEAIGAIAAFLSPVISALREDQPFEQHWLAGGPWRPGQLEQQA